MISQIPILQLEHQNATQQCGLKHHLLRQQWCHDHKFGILQVLRHLSSALSWWDVLWEWSYRLIFLGIHLLDASTQSLFIQIKALMWFLHFVHLPLVVDFYGNVSR